MTTPNELTQPPPATTKNREQATRDLIGVLANFCPQTFQVYERRRRPLKLGNRHDIEVAAAGAITAHEIEIALRSYCRNTGYLSACREGVARIGLDGKPAGHVTADEAGLAAHLLAYKLSKRLAASIPARTAQSAPPRLSFDDLRAAAAERRLRGAQPVPALATAPAKAELRARQLGLIDAERGDV
jgi:sRNA-binding protein